MKTVFITIFQGVEAKNILRTGIYRRLLAESDIRLVFFVKNRERAAYYRREFSHPRAAYEVVDGIERSFGERIFSFLKFHLIRTETLDLRRRMHLQEGGNAIGYAASVIFNRIFARRSVRWVVRWLDYHLVSERTFEPFFERYRPDAVFLAHLFEDVEIALLRTTLKRGVMNVGFINSWDKLTGRSMIRILPKTLVVYSGQVKAEAIELADMRPEDIIIAGIPQYDIYYPGPTMSREAFLQELGFNSDERFFVYAPLGRTFSDSDWDIVDLLESWIQEKRLPPDVRMLIRFQPNDFVDERELAKRPWLRYDYPGRRFSAERGVDWDMDEKDLEHLVNTLAHMSLLVCYASSLSVDAAIFDKPVINLGFETRPARFLSKSPVHYYRMTHYRKALDSGGIRFVRSRDELLDWMRRYLENPGLDRAGRERLVREQCGMLDGKAGERIATVVLEEMRKER